MAEDVSLIETPPEAAQPRHDKSEKITTQEASVLGVERLRKSYHKRAVVNDVSLAISQGEIVGLLGPNGAGKTTIFYMIVGLERPDAGRIYLNSKDISK